MAKTILFLCTGNYYRSRFAEELFNHLASTQLPGWTATSRALALETGIYNYGPMSEHAQLALTQRGISLALPIRVPQQVSEEDLAAANLIVAVKETEHRPYLIKRYPNWPDRVTYWNIHDLDKATPVEALTQIAEKVSALIEQLKQKHGAEK